MLIVVTTFGFANVIDDLAALELAARPLIEANRFEIRSGETVKRRIAPGTVEGLGPPTQVSIWVSIILGL
jgi:hypothetical protein